MILYIKVQRTMVVIAMVHIKRHLVNVMSKYSTRHVVSDKVGRRCFNVTVDLFVQISRLSHYRGVPKNSFISPSL